MVLILLFILTTLCDKKVKKIEPSSSEIFNALRLQMLHGFDARDWFLIIKVTKHTSENLLHRTQPLA